jgi:hypothetical protein
MTHAAILLNMLEEMKGAIQGTMTYPEQMVYLNLLREIRHLAYTGDIAYHPADTMEITLVDMDSENE